jgi:hypothetical protein
MDLWAPAEENSVERMASGTAAETPYIPQLLRHPELQQRLLARMSALLATALEPERAVNMADELFARHASELEADHERWKLELDRPEPKVSNQELLSFIRIRPGSLLEHLAKASDRKVRQVNIEAPSADQGVLALEGLSLLPGPHVISGFQDVALELTFTPAQGYELSGWKGVEGTSGTITIDPARARNVRPLVRPTAP